jgi:hypothetical protein
MRFQQESEELFQLGNIEDPLTGRSADPAEVGALSIHEAI